MILYHRGQHNYQEILSNISKNYAKNCKDQMNWFAFTWINDQLDNYPIYVISWARFRNLQKLDEIDHMFCGA